MLRPGILHAPKITVLLDHGHNWVFNFINMGIIDKNYLNRINQKVQNDLSKQPCGCDCNCRPKFESDAAGPQPGCNCQLGKNNYIVGDWSTGQSPQSTGQIVLQVTNGWNCPFEISFRWVNVNFLYTQSVGINLITPISNIQNLTESVWYTVTLNPGDYFQFDFTGLNQTYDQLLNIQAKNATCAQNYNIVGSWTLLSI